MNLDWPALGWGLLMLAAYAGWGRLVARLLLPSQAPHWGLDAAWGIAFTVVLGGIAHQLALFSRAAVIGYVITGAVLWLVQLARRAPAMRTAVVSGWRGSRIDWLATVLVLLLMAIVSVRYASSPVRRSYQAVADFAGVPFNMHDDMQSYLVMPEKLLQTGHLAPDPYNTRQLEATLGGMHVLNALGRAALPFENLHLVEDGVGLLAMTGALAALLGARPIPRRVRLLLLLVAQCSLVGNLNLSSYLSAAALFAAIMRLLLEPDPGRFLSWRHAAALGFLLAGGAALKSTLIPLLGLVVGIALLARLGAQPDRRFWRTGAVIAAVLLAGLLPWMALKYQTYGTPLFPLLGKGTHWTTYYTPPDDATATAWQVFLRHNRAHVPTPLIACVLAAIWLGVPRLRRTLPIPERALLAGIVGAWTISTFAMGLAGGGFDIRRYLMPLTMIGVPMALALAWPAGVRGLQSPRRWIVWGLAWGLPLTAWVWHHHRSTYAYLRLAIGDDLVGNYERFAVTSPERAQQATLLQSRVPAGANLWVRITHPYLLDFRRNPVFVADWPGAVSPAPGLPVFQGPEALAKYLLAHDVRYIAHSYANESFFQWVNYGWRTLPDEPHWERQVARMTFDVQANLRELGITRRRLFDDGEIFVLDLATYSGRVPALQLRPR